MSQKVRAVKIDRTRNATGLAMDQRALAIDVLKSLVQSVARAREKANAVPWSRIDSKFEEEDLWKRAIQAALRQFQGQVAAQNDEYTLELPNLNSQGLIEEMDDYIRKSFGLAP